MAVYGRRAIKIEKIISNKAFHFLSFKRIIS